jgi:enoyl-CoA hydratase/carnithine racemase
LRATLPIKGREGNRFEGDEVDPIDIPGLPDSLAASRDGGIVRLGLCRAAKRNAIDNETLAGIDLFFANLPPGTDAVILHGEGEHFCAGLDLSSLTETGAFEAVLHSRAWHRAAARIEHADVPVIAVLHGATVGGGLELASAAHIRIAERDTFYALPEGQRGIFVGGGASVRLPKLIGLARVMDMMLTGRTYGAEEGVTLGFSQYLAEPGEGMALALELARKVASNAKLSNFAILHAMPRIAESGAAEGYFTESLMSAIASSDEDAKSRLTAFLEKRAPKVTHKG